VKRSVDRFQHLIIALSMSGDTTGEFISQRAIQLTLELSCSSLENSIKGGY
jgi:hypothetical protein